MVANDLAEVGCQDIDIDTGALHGKSDAEAYCLCELPFGNIEISSRGVPSDNSGHG
jgi:hypothetical protein